ncbi:UNVERIFIED_CONTAM: hypothetical protein FKN15_029500 [Acipenser sinensis]
MSHSEDSISVILPATTSQELSQQGKTSISETEIATGRYCPDNIHGDNQELAQSGGEKIETTILLRSPGLPSNCQGPYVFQDAQENAGDPRTAPSYYDITLMEEKLQPVEQQLQYLLKKAEEFQTHLVYSYFLCCESKALGVWSIGQWIQTDPKPGDDDLLSWITCIQARGDYKQLLIIGSEEPSQIQATDLFLEVLLNQREQPTLSPGDRGSAMH